MLAPHESNNLEALTCLADPLRQKLYEYAVEQDRPVRRDEAAEAAGISRTLAAYHLDLLVDAGLLTTSYGRPAGKSGPGAGRPAKLYKPTESEISVSVPPRQYDVLASMLATAVEKDSSGQLQKNLLDAASTEGETAGSTDEDLLTVLENRGYAPEETEDGINLCNCPFHQLAKDHLELVCGMNHALLSSMMEARGEDPQRAELKPRAGYCCVQIANEEGTTGRSGSCDCCGS